jgi:hypothetical protein
MDVVVWNRCALAYEDGRNEREHSSELSKSNNDCAFVVLLDSFLQLMSSKHPLPNTEELSS